MKLDRERFWIRADRMQYFLPGVMVASVLGAFLSAYWHFTDIISVRPKIQRSVHAAPPRGAARIKDTQFYSPGLSGATRYYQAEQHLPFIPDLPEDENEGD